MELLQVIDLWVLVVLIILWNESSKKKIGLSLKIIIISYFHADIILKPDHHDFTTRFTKEIRLKNTNSWIIIW